MFSFNHTHHSEWGLRKTLLNKRIYINIDQKPLCVRTSLQYNSRKIEHALVPAYSLMLIFYK